MSLRTPWFDHQGRAQELAPSTPQDVIIHSGAPIFQIMDTSQIDPKVLNVIIVMSLLTLPLKGYSIWRASKNDQKGWFVSLYVFNTLGLLELIYLFYFLKPKSKQTD